MNRARHLSAGPPLVWAPQAAPLAPPEPQPATLTGWGALGAAKLAGSEPAPPPAAFEVEWSRLAFRVAASTPERALAAALKRACNLWRAAGAHPAPPAQEEPAHKLVLDNLHGSFRSGQLTAILGPSGAGKTSLLNAICGHTRGYSGAVRLVEPQTGAGHHHHHHQHLQKQQHDTTLPGAKNNSLSAPNKRRLSLSVIPQKDFLVERLSVRENLMYASRLLNPDYSEAEHEAAIMRVIKMLNLVHCLPANVANISGGEHKRVSIAQELLRQPDILVLDEPTSGLDSLNCKHLVGSLRQLIAASPKAIAIVMTIHQPDVDVLGQFDQLYCMARRGRVVFEGPPGRLLDTLRDHSGLEGRLFAGSMLNPANLMIEIASEYVHGAEPVERLARHQLRARAATPPQASGLALAASLAARSRLELAPNKAPPSWPPSQADPEARPEAPAELRRDKRLTTKYDHTGLFWYHSRILASRAFAATLRDPLMTMAALLFHLSLPLVMWTVYSRQVGQVSLCPSVQRDLELMSVASERVLERAQQQQEQLMVGIECSTMFFLTTYSFSMCALTTAALAFPLNMHLLLKELRNGWYGLSSFVLAKSVASFPFEVLMPVASIVLIYLLLGMPSSPLEWRLCAIAAVVALIAMISNTHGLVWGALFMDSVQSAIFMASASTLPLILLSGFTARIKQMPQLLQHLSWLSMYRYSSDSINLIRFGFGNCPCDAATDAYLRAKEPQFTDIPAHLRPIFGYYITNNGPPSEPANATATNATELLVGAARDSLAGIATDLTLNATERAALSAKIDANQVDLFSRMADMLARSFTYGRDVKNCQQLRSEVLNLGGAPPDDYLPLMFLGMLLLLVVSKLALLAIVRFKINSRVK